MPESFERGALTEATFLILVSLFEPRHGYAVIKNIQSLTGGRVRLGAGTLYGALGLLAEKGWIASEGGDERKKYYRATEGGKYAVIAEMDRLMELLAIGKRVVLDGDGYETRGRGN